MPREWRTTAADRARLSTHRPLGEYASPNFTHRQALEPLFAAGLHILCENPLCKTLEDAIWAVDAAAQQAGSHHGATFRQLEAFPAAADGTGPVLVNAEDGLRAVAIGMAAEISAREKRVVEMVELGF